MFNTFIQRHKFNELAIEEVVVMHLLNTGKLKFILGLRRMVNKQCLQGLILNLWSFGLDGMAKSHARRV